MNALKYTYVSLIVLYVLITVAWCIKFSLSYELMNVRPDIVKVRDLAEEERFTLIRATKFRQTIGKIYLNGSLVLCVVSIIYRRNKWYKPAGLVKVIFVITLVISLILLLVESIAFIPMAPIR